MSPHPLDGNFVRYHDCRDPALSAEDALKLLLAMKYPDGVRHDEPVIIELIRPPGGTWKLRA